MNTCIQILNSETAQVLGPIFCPQCKLVDKEDALNTAQVHPCWNRFLKHAKYAQCAISPVWCFTRCKSPLTLSISQHVCRFSVCIRFILYPFLWITVTEMSLNPLLFMKIQWQLSIFYWYALIYRNIKTNFSNVKRITKHVF